MSSHSRPKRLLAELRRQIRLRQYSRRTEKTYVGWVRRFVKFHGMRHPRELKSEDVQAFLSFLATDRGVAAATQNQAASALLFLYANVLRLPLERLDVVRPRPPERIPVVLTKDEVAAVLDCMHGVHGLVARILYGSGVRLHEALRLRVKDVDLARRELALQDTKGGRGRHTVLSDDAARGLRSYLRGIRVRYERDVQNNVRVPLPGAFARKSPLAWRDWPWYWVFPSQRTTSDPDRQMRWRFHLHPSGVQRAVRRAARAAGLQKRVTCHTFRHSFATHLLQAGYDIRTVQELLGHRDVRTTMMYTHVLNRGGLAVRSPGDTLPPFPAGDARLTLDNDLGGQGFSGRE